MLSKMCKNQTIYTLLVTMWKSMATLEKKFGSFLQKWTCNFHKTKQIALLGIYFREMKSYDMQNLGTCMFIAALFLFAKTGNNPNVLQLVNDEMVSSRHILWNTKQWYEMNCSYMQKLGWISRELCWVKKSNS